ncbi:dapper homolog 3-like [Schistocerca nitens]|uniref:dapper homolog 3-like n=1 Tax=Schistocerca nitens TaxID=7011 RepID=UPI00211989C2|nr:dapper homolog 3-like [Schistocerca nitens]
MEDVGQRVAPPTASAYRGTQRATGQPEVAPVSEEAAQLQNVSLTSPSCRASNPVDRRAAGRGEGPHFLAPLVGTRPRTAPFSSTAGAAAAPSRRPAAPPAAQQPPSSSGRLPPLRAVSAYEDPRTPASHRLAEATHWLQAGVDRRSGRCRCGGARSQTARPPRGLELQATLAGRRGLPERTRSTCTRAESEHRSSCPTVSDRAPAAPSRSEAVYGSSAATAEDRPSELRPRRHCKKTSHGRADIQRASGYISYAATAAARSRPAATPLRAVAVNAGGGDLHGVSAPRRAPPNNHSAPLTKYNIIDFFEMFT